MQRHDAGAVEEYREKGLQSLLMNVSASLLEAKKQHILDVQIRKTARELDYLDEKIALVRKNLDQITRENEEMETRLAGSNSALSAARQARELAEKECADLDAVESEMAKNRERLGELKALVSQALRAFQRETLCLKERRAERQTLLDRKALLEKETRQLSEKSDRLVLEINASRSTRDMLSRLIPEEFGTGTEALPGEPPDYDAAVMAHFDELNHEIGSLEQETAQLNAQLMEKQALEKTLISTEAALERKIADLLSMVDGSVEEGQLEAELTKMAEEKADLHRKAGEMAEVINRLDGEVASLDKSLEETAARTGELAERQDHLASRVGEVARFDDIGAEIERMEDEALRYARAAAALQNKCMIVHGIVEALAPTNDQLRQALEAHRDQLGRFHQAMGDGSPDVD